MTFLLRFVQAACMAALLSASAMAAPVRLIVDTDMQTDCDDAGALAVLHALADRGEVEILATMVGVENEWAAPCTDAINTYYGRPDLPIGQLKGRGVKINSKFAQGVAESFPQDTTAASAPDAVTLYRQILAKEPDQSVVIATLGYMTNLQNLLNSPADAISPLTGKELIARKVKKWVCMGGNFPNDAEKKQVSGNVNFRRDAPAAIDTITNWPGPIEFVGREIGHSMKAGKRLAETPADNPVRRSYELFFSGKIKDQHCADLATILYAVRGPAFEGTTYWGLVDSGSVHFTETDARFQWVASPDAQNQAYITEALDRKAIGDLLEDLMVQPPKNKAATPTSRLPQASGAAPPQNAAATPPPRPQPSTNSIPQWERFEAEVVNAKAYADPYRDVTLDVTYTSPSGKTIPFWGYYDGGQSWKLRFMPGEPGAWKYDAKFSDGSAGKSGSFTCAASERPATIGAYAPNPRWFGHRDGKPFLVRSFHAAGLFKFAIDDPANPNDGEKRTAFLDWAQAQGYNTFSAPFFSTRNETDKAGPKLWPLNHEAYRKVEMILDDLSRRSMVAYAFTGFFGNSGPYPTSPEDRTLYIRYCLARFGPYWNIIMNVGGFEVRDYLSDAEIKSLGAEIAAANPFGQLLGAHQRDGDDRFRDEPWCTLVTLQDEITDLPALSAYLLKNQVPGKPVYAQETLWMGNKLQPNWSLTDLRKQMWVHMMSAASYNAGDMAGKNESGFGGSLVLSEKIQERHDIPKAIWDFMASVPFYTLSPRQDLRTSGYMLANPRTAYLCYLPEGGGVDIAVESAGAPYKVTWVNAQNPLGDQRPGGTTKDGKGLTAPDGQDWLVYLTRPSKWTE